MYEAFRVTQFGDLIDIKLGINTEYIFEQMGNKLQNKLKLGEAIARDSIDGSTSPKLSAIQEVLAYHDKACVVRIVYTKYDHVSYLLRPEDYDSFISNLFHCLDDTLAKGKPKPLSVMETRVAQYQIFNLRSINNQQTLAGLDPSPKSDECLLSHAQLGSADGEERISELLANSLMQNKLNFGQLLSNVMDRINEMGNLLDNLKSLDVMKLMKDNRDQITSEIFNHAYNKNLFCQDQSKPLPPQNLLVDLKNKLNNDQRELERLINDKFHLGKSKEGDSILKDFQQKILICLRALNFLVVSTNNAQFFKDMPVQINIPRTNLTEDYKNLLRSLVKMSFQCKFHLTQCTQDRSVMEL